MKLFEVIGELIKEGKTLQDIPVDELVILANTENLDAMSFGLFRDELLRRLKG